MGTISSRLALAGILVAGLGAPGLASHDGSRTCFGAKPTILGTQGDDVLRGGPGRDVIMSLGGNDEVYGLRGRDAVCAGPGDDRAAGGPGSDFVAAGDGADEAFGGKGVDFVAEDHGTATVADVGDDTSADAFFGGRGDDVVADDAGDDSLDGGPGADTFFGLFSPEPMVIDLREGRATTVTESNVLIDLEHVVGTASADVIRGDEEENALAGFLGADQVLGEGGADLLLSMVDGDVLTGGDGETPDAAFAVVSESVRADLAEGTVSGSTGTDRLLGIEDFIGTAKGDVIIGSQGANRLYGGGGDDTLEGGEGDDSLTGDSPFGPWLDLDARQRELLPRGADSLDGGPGNDWLDGGPLDDTCTEGERLRRCESVDRPQPVAHERRAGDCCFPAPFRAWLVDLLRSGGSGGLQPPFPQ